MIDDYPYRHVSSSFPDAAASCRRHTDTPPPTTTMTPAPRCGSWFSALRFPVSPPYYCYITVTFKTFLMSRMADVCQGYYNISRDEEEDEYDEMAIRMREKEERKRA